MPARTRYWSDGFCFMEHRLLKKSLNVRRNAVVGRHRTSVCLEEAFWKTLHEIAAARNIALSNLLPTIDSRRHHDNLTSAIRVFQTLSKSTHNSNRSHRLMVAIAVCARYIVWYTSRSRQAIP